MDSLQIEVVVLNLQIPSMPMHLDDILAAGKKIAYLEGNGPELDNFDNIIRDLPLDCVPGDDRIWKASAFKWSQMKGKYMRPITQRISADKFAHYRDNGLLKIRANKLNQNSGPLKSSIDLRPSVAFCVGKAFCVGDKKKIERLLSKITCLGKQHQRGQGVVKTWTVSASGESDAWRYRHLPLSANQFITDDHVLVSNIGINPPYWRHPHPMGYGLASC